jgi:REP element-mobilizing transposase RayT
MQLLPDRKSPRAERYNYTSAGVYFITICTQDHEEYFGKVVDGDMVLNEIGEVCKQEIQRLNERQTVDIHEWVVMPNHIHLLLCMNERNEAKENTNG